MEEVKNSAFPVPSYEEWKELAEASLKGKSFDSLITRTYEEIDLQPIYTAESLKASGKHEEFPGVFPFTRGINHTGYKEIPWQVCQFVSGKTSEQINENMKKSFLRGQDAIAVDAAALLELDAASLAVVLNGINTEDTPFYLDLQGCQLPFLAILQDYCSTFGINSASLSGVIAEDPISEWSQEGKIPADIEGYFTRWFEGLKKAKEVFPQMKTLLVKGSAFHNGGATAVQELAYALAAAVQYLQEGLKNGLDPGIIAEKIVFSFGIDSNYFMNIAKIRAARRLWAYLADAYEASRESFKMHIHAETSSLTETIYDQHVNILRSANQAFAAVVGGVQYLTVRPFDAAAGAEEELAARLAGNVQLILKEETLITAVADPAGGSWYVEALTDELTEKAWDKFLQIDQEGGILQLLKVGFIQEEIREVFSRKQQDAATRKTSIVGTNVYANNAEEKILSQQKKLPPTGTAAAASSMPDWDQLIEVFSSAPLQDYRSIIEQVFPAERIQQLKAVRISSQYEFVRIRLEMYKQSHGQRLQVGLINLKDIKSFKPRADFISGFFASGGIEVIQSEGCQSIHEVEQFVENSGISHYCLCGSDTDYWEFAEEIVSKLTQRFGTLELYLAGKQPEEQANKLREAGLNDFIHARTNAITFLEKMLQSEGVKGL
ncbi:methylmalonyl-CoA mutase family protein [Bacillus sp. M6-12]|uniref:methylmalonyl-CoA mutase family protein n=1 Tax=Bacillus sp. M6-12 TaxID=2054166 RepID=UPI00115AFEF9|nr:methylmalonyl-CoA mutase family protein [Bacillus sp. M6-12]